MNSSLDIYRKNKRIKSRIDNFAIRKTSNLVWIKVTHIVVIPVGSSAIKSTIVAQKLKSYNF